MKLTNRRMDTGLGLETAHEIERLSELGSTAFDRGNLIEAAAYYESALSLIPEPMDQFREATWLLAALGDIAFLNGEFSLAQRYMREATACPDGIGTGFIHLRLGQVELELGNIQRAADELLRAYLLSDNSSANFLEGEDPKYLEFLRTARGLP